MTHPTIQRKKDRMCRRFGHLLPQVLFRTRLGVMAYYCARCGMCCARASDQTVQPRVAEKA